MLKYQVGNLRKCNTELSPNVFTFIKGEGEEKWLEKGLKLWKVKVENLRKCSTELSRNVFTFFKGKGEEKWLEKKFHTMESK